MTRRLFLPMMLIIAVAVTSLLASPQATFVLKNGERHTGTLVYRGDDNFNLIIGGEEKRFPQDQIAVVEFVPGPPPTSELAALPASDNPPELERNMIVLRDGSTVHGKVYNITNNGETLTIDTREGQRRDIPTSNIKRLYMSAPAARSVFNFRGEPATAPPAESAGGAVQVAANRQWNDAGIVVQRGEQVSFRTTGDIRWGGNADQSAGPDGSGTVLGRQINAPVPEMGAGGLIGRVQSPLRANTPFPIGSNSNPITMPATGRLQLGVNDTEFNDNSGSFTVVITRQITSRRR